MTKRVKGKNPRTQRMRSRTADSVLVLSSQAKIAFGTGSPKSITFSISPGGWRALCDRCHQLLDYFGPDWCREARFVHCGVTVADILVPRNENMLKTSEIVRASTEASSGRWLLDGPFDNKLFTPWWLHREVN